MIYKTKFTITVLSEDEPFRTSGLDNDPFDLLAIHQAIYDGECIGSVKRLGSLVVPDDRVEAELVAIGNDGTFFDTQDDFGDINHE